MALIFKICRPGDIPLIFAAHDEFISRLVTARCDMSRHEMAEAYTAPFCFMPSNVKDKTVEGGYIIFTPQVPWTNDVHRFLASEMYNAGRRELPIIESSVEKCQLQLGLSEAEVYTFTKHGGYPQREEIGSKLDEQAVKVTCAAAGWKVPNDWHQLRSDLSRRRCIAPLLNYDEFVDGSIKENEIDSLDVNDTIDCNSIGVREGESYHI